MLIFLVILFILTLIKINRIYRIKYLIIKEIFLIIFIAEIDFFIAIKRGLILAK